ncbi:LysR family transcriptional regulator [Aerococcus viridans]|uniref:LysR family transcriptional regulator n=1 Tax=Aerococcus viridans TaxID=1377 RepID=A0A2N6UGE4_9LACT|nr:LysR family transcriptional regulator [Aerococcus viridans]PMC80632.1 LysR family transcriptional regulator [Aerococcus viridans]
MRIEDLQYFMKVVEVGNMTQAAKELFIAQPSLSKAMTNLEAEMGITLFQRTAKGTVLTVQGEEFLQYARQVLEQIDLMNHRYKEGDQANRIFSVSGQHYAFVVDAFVKLLREMDADQYEATLKEERTFEVLDDVANFTSEIGVIYRSNYNQKVLEGAFQEKQLTFTPLFKAAPHVFIDKGHPLAKQTTISLDDLTAYPRLSYEQGTHNSFYYWEEILADIPVPKRIIVSDRATLFNLLIGLDGYTISSGIINDDLNSPDILAIPLESDEVIELGYLTANRHQLSSIAKRYLALLEESIQQYAK